MKAKIVKIREEDSRYGGRVYHVFFKTEEGKPLRTYVYKNCRNYQRWAWVIQKFLEKQTEIWIKNFLLLNEKKRLIDADSLFEIEEVCPCPESDISNLTFSKTKI